MKPIILVAFDPGLTGAFAFYNPDAPDRVTVHDMPVVDKQVDPAAIARRLKEAGPSIAVVERVASRPGQGVASMFKFGCGYGMVQGVVAALQIPVVLVTPQAWKKYHRIAGSGPDAKEAARALAIKLWPASAAFERKKDAGRAEAALLARYAAETLGSHQVGNVVRAA
ncbi:hypothetical protein [Enterovirga aerilata]|uniref:Uncharacterized protein n=1 Tax=Enterovirga aerilata TaxID=2730920 RepID=A0A849ICA7_9HYPH|nr:hypothetical protein [Enterovirga sp. DB1703]NNM75038.1 hypothetical protein [Enterovirga sp. DB1703]